LPSEIQQKLGRRDEEDAVTGKNGLVRDVLGDHRLSEALGGDEDDVSRGLEEVQAKRRLDERALDLLGPIPVEVGHGFESAEATASAPAFEAAASAVLFLEEGDVLEELAWTPSFLGGHGDEVVQVGGGDEQTELAKT
jgi:hypothetical protein